jgi:hypothetical protein
MFTDDFSISLNDRATDEWMWQAGAMASYKLLS